MRAILFSVRGVVRFAVGTRFSSSELVSSVSAELSSSVRVVGIGLLIAVASLSLLVVESRAQNSQVYGTMSGTDITFIDVSEHSTKPLPLFGPPITVVGPPGNVFPCTVGDNCTVAGNTLTFSPALFQAQSASSSPVQDETDGQLKFMAQSKPGKAIENLFLKEGGRFSVSGLVGTTADTYVDVGAVGFVQVLEVDGVGIQPLEIPIDMVFDFGVGGNGTWRFAPEGVANSKLWTGSILVDVEQALINAGRTFTLGATKVNFNLDNVLFAQSEPTGSAAIDKKLFFIVTVNLPEPASGLLVLCGLCGLAMIRRRS